MSSEPMPAETAPEAGAPELQLEKVLRLSARMLKRAPDDDLSVCVEIAGQSIRNYCNISEVPEALNAVWAAMAARLSHRMEDSMEPEVSSVTEDGRSVSFVSAMEASALTDPAGIKELNRYRRLYRGI